MSMYRVVFSALLLLLVACGSEEGGSADTCDPACATGTDCVDGACVPADGSDRAADGSSSDAPDGGGPDDTSASDAGGADTADEDTADASEEIDAASDAGDVPDGSLPDVAEDAAEDADATPDTGDTADAVDDVATDTPPDSADDAGADSADGADTAPGDADDADDADDIDTTPDADVAPDTTPPASVRFTAPREGETTSPDRPLELSVLVDPSDGAAGVTVRWSSDLDGALGTSIVGEDGVATTTIPMLSVGIHTLAAEVLFDDGTVSSTVRVGVCGWLDTATFDDALPEEWTVYGDAYRDDRGWLEMTGALQGQGGAIANTVRPIADGDTRLRFRVATGQCNTVGPCAADESTGADGFALSIFDVPGAATISDIIDAAASGGGLGYGIAGGWGTYTGGPVDAFHIEFDTWYNRFNGSNEFHTDPTSTNHIGITLDGNPGDHRLWAETPTLENNEWHDVEVIIEGARVTVIMDDATIIDDEIADFVFKGGYVVFTGTTGFYYNYHRFDELQVIEDCRVE